MVFTFVFAYVSSIFLLTSINLIKTGLHLPISDRERELNIREKLVEDKDKCAAVREKLADEKFAR